MSETTALTRDQIRARVFSGANKPKKKVIDFFGSQIELRQPTLSQVLDAQANDDREAAVIDMLINRAYVPNTEESVFEETDAESLKALPFTGDFVRVSNAFEDMTDVNFRDRQGKTEEKSDTPVDNETSVGAEEV